jgi:nitrogen fixation protein
MKVMIRRNNSGVLSAYVAKKDLEVTLPPQNVSLNRLF